VAPAILLTLAAGVLIGLTSGLLVVRAHIDSFVATLGTSSVLLALIAWISGSEQIIGLNPSFASIASTEVLGVTFPVWAMLAVAAVAWYVLEHTAVGRYCYATGGNIDAARLAGVRTSLVIVGSFIACGVITTSAGMLVSSRIDAGDPTVGPSYLLPAFTAAFLGSTQFRAGRFNVWGTVVAVYVLATGVQGLQLAGAPVWIPDLFNGVALLVAVGAAKRVIRPSGRARVSSLLRRSSSSENRPPDVQGAVQ
jgi:ribose transport system permease protein